MRECSVDRMRVLFAAVILGVAAGTSPAEVANVAPNGFAVKHSMTIPASPQKVYEALVGKVG